MQKYDTIERILVILIMLVEVVIMFKAMTISLMLGIGSWLMFHVLDALIANIHRKYFR